MEEGSVVAGLSTHVAVRGDVEGVTEQAPYCRMLTAASCACVLYEVMFSLAYVRADDMCNVQVQARQGMAK